MIHLFMITLDSFENRNEVNLLTELLQKAYIGIETLSNGFQNNFLHLVKESPVNLALQGNLAENFCGAINECLKTKDLVFVSLTSLTIIELDRYSLAGDALRLKLNLLHIKLVRLEKDYHDYTILSEAIDLMDVITDLVALLQKLNNLVVHVNPLIDILQVTQSLLKEISRI